MNDILTFIPWPIQVAAYVVTILMLLVIAARETSREFERRRIERNDVLAKSMRRYSGFVVSELDVEFDIEQEEEEEELVEEAQGARGKKPFTSLRDYDFGHDFVDEDVDPEWEPQPYTEWTRMGGATLDMVDVEYRMIMEADPPPVGSGLIIVRPGFSFDGSSYSASKQLTVVRAKPGTFGMFPWERLAAKQGYCSGGFHLDLEFTEQV